MGGEPPEPSKRRLDDRARTNPVGNIGGVRDRRAAAAAISATTACAGAGSAPLPVMPAPRSLTSTQAPWRARVNAWLRPMPRPRR
jgi:hypothetical protein